MIFQKWIKHVKEFFLILNIVIRTYFLGYIVKHDFLNAFLGAIATYLDKEEENYYRICALSFIWHPIRHWKRHKWHQKYYHLE